MIREHFRPFFVALLLLLLATRTVQAQGLLGGVRSEVKQERQKSESSHHGGDEYDHDDDDDDGWDFVGSILGAVLFGSDDDHHHHDDHHHNDDESQRNFDWGSDPVEPSPEMYFARYPYADDLDGFMMRDDWVPARPQTWSARTWFEYGDDFDTLSRWTGRFLVEGCSNWGLDGRWNVYTERISPGVTDNQNIGDANIFLRLGETQNVLTRFGFGMNWLEDNGSADLGWNMTLKMDIYPARPLVLSGGLDYGSLGGAEMFHGEISVGVIWDRFEIFGGYDYRKIGSVKLEGPMFGARIWF